MQLTVITATWRRPKLLKWCLEQFRQQSTGNLQVEQVVVSDGPDPAAEELAQQYGVEFAALDEREGRWGAAPRDRGIELARGNYVCFWDDDNLYRPHAVATLFAAASGCDIGVVQVEQHTKQGWTAIPRRWSGQFVRGDVDTMCFCVRRELALTEKWSQVGGGYCVDHAWISRLAEKTDGIRYVPIVIGAHL